MTFECLLQERLRTLRASLGSARDPATQHALQALPQEEHQMQQEQAESQPSSKAGGLTTWEGLCSLLELHLATLEHAQQPLHDLLQAQLSAGEDEVDVHGQ